jgi:hypothetical protein
MRSTTLDCWAPAKADQAPILVVRAGLGDSMAGTGYIAMVRTWARTAKCR